MTSYCLCAVLSETINSPTPPSPPFRLHPDFLKILRAINRDCAHLVQQRILHWSHENIVTYSNKCHSIPLLHLKLFTDRYGDSHSASC